MSQPQSLQAIPKDFTITITDAAAKQVRRVIERHSLPETTGLRVGATEGGCSGFNYDVQVVEGPRAEDRVYEINNTTLFVNEFSMPYVNGMTVDWISSMQESRFVFRNPNATGECGCGVSFSLT
jgi:iron-sulfur cluster assembly accessory protein